ncbi:MAG: hypothetical protein H6817_11310 [Phycisphaerales bacterium]|nr:hypothetical protein [Phycisphaerales bacterium]
MSTEVVNMFHAIGANVEIRNEKFRRHFDPHARRLMHCEPFARAGQTPVRVDVRTVDGQERFEVSYAGRDATLRVVDVDRARQHLLLAVSNGETDQADKFLCGFDERHWFSAAVPSKGVYSIATAMEALMPPAVRTELDRNDVAGDERYSRRSETFIRQGEWFFVPTNRSFGGKRILKREPLVRTAGGKPHILEFAYRLGGQIVYVCQSRNLTLSLGDYQALLRKNPDANGWRWSQMTRDPELYARGRVWHPDHATLHLGRWHRVHVNEEHRAPSRANLMFLD